jgi:hypothetical protein
MKAFNKILVLFGIVAIFIGGCTKDFDQINTDPNYPTEVTTCALFTAAQKSLMDDMMDEWWAGRQSQLYAQYWTQRNYTSEDRYAMRQNNNNTYFRLLYTDIMDLVEIIRLNEDPLTRVKYAIYGDNDNQIACAKILKAWAMQVMTDTYGDIPYSEAFQGNTEAEILNPKYDRQQDIYQALLNDLKAAVDMINVDASGFSSGDIIYGGDMTKWKKFGNSLRLRVALRMSYAEETKYAKINEIIAENAGDPEAYFTSNADNAIFSYIGSNPNVAPVYNALWNEARNDFTMCKTLIELLKGDDDTLNGKINPFHGLVDPRLQIYSRPKGGVYNGMPYGMTDAQSQVYKGKCPSFYYDLNGKAAYSPVTATVVHNPRWSPVYMDYAEVEFILSEVNNFEQAHYINGVRASIEYWRDMAVDFERWSTAEVNDFNIQLGDYIAALPAANEENVMTQKYIAFYMQGYQAWAEYRRSGYPLCIVLPGQVTHRLADGTDIIFNALEETHGGVPRRVTYPQQEYTVNGTNTTAAAVQIKGDYLYTHVWWDKKDK